MHTGAISCDQLLPPCSLAKSLLLERSGAPTTAKYHDKVGVECVAHSSPARVPHAQLLATVRTVCTTFHVHTAVISCDQLLGLGARAGRSRRTAENHQM